MLSLRTPTSNNNNNKIETSKNSTPQASKWTPTTSAPQVSCNSKTWASTTRTSFTHPSFLLARTNHCFPSKRNKSRRPHIKWTNCWATWTSSLGRRKTPQSKSSSRRSSKWMEVIYLKIQLGWPIFRSASDLFLRTIWLSEVAVIS